MFHSAPDLTECRQLEELNLRGTARPGVVPDLTQCKGLKRLSLSHCSDLEQTPDLSQFRKLEILKLDGCRRLTAAPDLTQCGELKLLDMSDCWNLPSAPDLTCCTKLEDLTLADCRSLTVAPDLTGCKKLERLDMHDCAELTAGPDLTQCGELIELNLENCHDLQSVPDLRQCRKLEALALDNCDELTAAPDLTQCTDLIDLSMRDCHGLQSAPDLTQCKELETLDFYHCDQLTAPPDLTQCSALKVLNLGDCSSLARPPDLRQCPDLTDLNLSGCYGIVTPPLFATHENLRHVFMHDTPLTSLPTNLLQFPPGCHVRFSLGSLSEAVRRALQLAVETTPEDALPRMNYDMGNASPAAAAKPLEIETESWWAASGTLWKDFAEDQYAQDFSAFLGKIRQTSEYRNEGLREDVEGRVRALLQQLADPGNLELRKRCFAQAREAVSSCEDRIAMTLLQLETACSVSKITAAVAQGNYDQDRLALLKQGAGMYHLQQLEDIARNKVATMRFIDEIEVHLGYLVKLSGEFSLPVQMNTMRYPACSDLHEPDIAAARAQLQRCVLNTSPDPELVRFLSSWEPLVALLQRPATAYLAVGHAQALKDEIKAEKDNLQQALDQLDPNAENYDRQAQGLLAQYNGIESAVATRRHGDAIGRLIAEALNA